MDGLANGGIVDARCALYGVPRHPKYGTRLEFSSKNIHLRRRWHPVGECNLAKLSFKINNTVSHALLR